MSRAKEHKEKRKSIQWRWAVVTLPPSYGRPVIHTPPFLCRMSSGLFVKVGYIYDQLYHIEMKLERLQFFLMSGGILLEVYRKATRSPLESPLEFHWKVHWNSTRHLAERDLIALNIGVTTVFGHIWIK